MIESTAQQLDLTGGEGAERGWGLAPGPAAAVAAAVRLDAGDDAGDAGDAGEGGGGERRPTASRAGDNASDGRDGREDAAQEGALTRPLEGLSDPQGGLPGLLVGGGGNGGGLRHLRQCRREAAPHGDGSGLRCRWLGSRRHGSDPQNCACGAQQRARLDGRVVPAINSPLEEGFNRDIDPLEGAAALLLVEQSLNETPGLPGVDVRRLGAEHRPEGVNDTLEHGRLGGGRRLRRRGRSPCRSGGWGRRCGHVSSFRAQGGVAPHVEIIPPLLSLDSSGD